MRWNRIGRRVGIGAAFLLLAALGAGCASKPMRIREGDPSTSPPWRVAVLPTQPPPAEKGKKPVDMAKDALDDTRTCIALQIPPGPFDVIPLPVVDRDRAPAPDAPATPEEIIATARALHADLLLVPEAYSWRRRYYLIHGVARVGAQVKLYDGRTGALLFESRHEQVKNEGTFNIPLGLVPIVAGPILGLQPIHMSYMCNEIARRIGEDLLRAYGSIAAGAEAGSRGVTAGESAR